MKKALYTSKGRMHRGTTLITYSCYMDSFPVSAHPTQSPLSPEHTSLRSVT